MMEEKLKNSKKNPEEIEVSIIGNPPKIEYVSNGNGNVITRISKKFNKRVAFINKKRKDQGESKLSFPKITELIVRHKLWYEIQKDLVKFSLQEDLKQEYADEKQQAQKSQ